MNSQSALFTPDWSEMQWLFVITCPPQPTSHAVQRADPLDSRRATAFELL